VSLVFATEYFDVVNARVVGVTVIVQNVQSQRTRQGWAAAAGCIAHENLRGCYRGDNSRRRKVKNDLEIKWEKCNENENKLR
jgi:hypothetical protein